MRHALGVLGILAAGVLLAVSAAMNWRFGFSLGRTEFDGMIYGSASAAADCLKALIPFFLFAAIRSRMWSQAIASAVVGIVVVSYSLTSALGHAALNRLDVAGKRQAAASTYKDLRSDLARAQEQAGWIPQHRPMLSVQADIDAAKTQSAWRYTKGCSKVTGPKGRSFCQSFHALSAELAAADQAATLEAKIAGLNEKLGQSKGGSVMSEADPQAAVLAKLGGHAIPGLEVEDVQTALTVFIALLLEVGSGLGLYIAFSQWRLYDHRAPSRSRWVKATNETVMVGEQAPIPSVLRTTHAATDAPSVDTTPSAPKAPSVVVSEPVNDDVDIAAEVDTPAVPEAEVAAVAASSVEPSKPRIEAPRAKAPGAKALRAGANDNKSKPKVAQRFVAPETDVERFYRESVETQDGSSMTATALYEEYCAWCEERGKEPMALPTFGRQFGELGVQKAKVAGRVRYIGIALKSAEASREDKKQPAFDRKAA
ncbi:MAG: hypothetical protein K0U34_03950 [Alphaproteobacteria bacterium]|nr:hypothetical protein [Alphaproteobacteria bacterium]